MKRFVKTIMVIVIITTTLAALTYGIVFLGHRVFFKLPVSDTPTIESVTDGIITLGPQDNPPASAEEFMPLLAEQLKRYNEIAPTLWPDNAVNCQTLIVESVRGNKFWLIAPDGTISSLTKNEALSYGFTRSSFSDGFSFFNDGMYYAINENDLTNYLKWQKYLHIGTHDALLFLTHEGFHAKEQQQWPVMNNIANAGRNEFLDNLPARTKRSLLQKQLLKAVSEPGNTALILEALATYEDYKNQFPEDYINSVYLDRIEGTAYYYELITGLYSGYPGQITNREDLDRALALLATREDNYVWHGLASESYVVGGFACVLLDRLEDDWKEKLINNPDATPIEMLYQHFADEQLPEPMQITQADIDEVNSAISQPADIRPIARIFRLFYDTLL